MLEYFGENKIIQGLYTFTVYIYTLNASYENYIIKIRLSFPGSKKHTYIPIR